MVWWKTPVSYCPHFHSRQLPFPVLYAKVKDTNPGTVIIFISKQYYATKPKARVSPEPAVALALCDDDFLTRFSIHEQFLCYKNFTFRSLMHIFHAQRK